MGEKTHPPSIKETAFECPHCGAYTTQHWYVLFAKKLGEEGDILLPIVPNNEWMKRVENECGPRGANPNGGAYEYCRITAQKIAIKIGAKSISKNSNEFIFKCKNITIRCAKHLNNNFGVSYKMPERVDSIIDASEQKNGQYALYEISPKIFKKKMRESKTSKGKVGLVSKSVFITEGKLVCRVSINEI